MMTATDYAARAHLHRPKSPDEMREAVNNMASNGYGDYIIAAATRLSVEVVRQMLGEHRERCQ